jgi:thiamine biosynthesis protein ThiS
MQVTVNGAEQRIPQPFNVAELVGLLELKKERVAIELNRSLVPRAQWDSTFLSQGDLVEIVHFVGGG